MAPQPQALARLHRRLPGTAEAPWLHQEVARRMADKLALIRREPAAWLDWWSARGGGQALLAQRYPQAARLVVEPTVAAQATMRTAMPSGPLAWLRRQPRSQVWLESDWQPAEPVPELLWANMMLHWVADPLTLLRRWHEGLAIDGVLMLSTFGPDTLAELRQLYRDLGWPAPVHDFQDMHDLGDQLVVAGFADPVMDMERLTLTWPDADALLAELRTWGGNAHPGRFTGLRTPRWRARLAQILQDRLAGADGRLALTLEIVYGHAVRPLPRPKLAGETRVSLDDMRAMTRSRRAGS